MEKLHNSLKARAKELYDGMGEANALNYVAGTSEFEADVKGIISEEVLRLSAIDTRNQDINEYMNNRIKDDFRTYLMQTGQLNLMDVVTKGKKDD